MIDRYLTLSPEEQVVIGDQVHQIYIPLLCTFDLLFKTPDMFT